MVEKEIEKIPEIKLIKTNSIKVQSGGSLQLLDGPIPQPLNKIKSEPKSK